MASGEKEPRDGAGYSHNYGGNYAGYSAVGYGDGASAHAQRTFQDFILILRERIWYILVVFFVVVASAIVYTASDTRIYQSTATVQIFRSDPTIMQMQQMMDTSIRSTEDLQTQIKVIESYTIIKAVAERITGDDLRDFLAPYEKASADSTFVTEIIARNRKVALQRLTLVVNIAYQHPNRFVAAKVANLFVDEYLNHNQRVRATFQTKAVEELQLTVDDQRKKVDQIARKLQKYKEDNKSVSLDKRKDIVSESLRAINLEVQKAQIVLQTAETKWDQIKDHRKKGADLTGLQFIASAPNIALLTQQLALQKIAMAKLSERYLERHPDMIAARNIIAQTERELEKAVSSVSDQIEADYQSSLRNYQQRVAELDKHKAESIELDRAAVEYDQIERDFRTQDLILQSISARQRETSMTSNIETQSARVVDHASPSPETKPISPNVALNAGVGSNFNKGGAKIGARAGFTIGW